MNLYFSSDEFAEITLGHKQGDGDRFGPFEVVLDKLVTGPGDKDPAHVVGHVLYVS